jgi:nucleoside-diphosphate-sugar epimerase
MRVIVAGGHGQIGLRLLRLLREHGDEGVGLIRNPDHADDLPGEALVLDLEAVDEVGSLDADAIVFAAGAGPGSGAERKWTMDYGGAAKLMRAGVQRYVIVSAMGAANPPPEGEGDVFGEYVRAKAKADQELAASGLDYTIVRPGMLTDDPGTGRVHVAERLPRGEIPRDDVARVLHAVLHEPSTIGAAFDLVGGDTPIDEALERL